MEDEEAILLVQALPSHVRDLELRCIGMGNALASNVRAGPFQYLKTLRLGSNEDVTDQAVAETAPNPPRPANFVVVVPRGEAGIGEGEVVCILDMGVVGWGRGCVGV